MAEKRATPSRLAGNMKTKEQRQQATASLIDTGQRIRELDSLRGESAALRDQLFEECCKLQRDPLSVEAGNLSLLAFRVRELEKRREKLESMIAALKASAPLE